MKKSNVPPTLFSTPLSGSARQAEARIRNLFQGPKRRPPVWLMALVLLLILSCGGLISCRSQEESGPSSASSQPLSGEEQLLVDALYGAAAPQVGAAEAGAADPRLLCAQSQDGTALAAALFQRGSAAWLVIGAVDQDAGTLRGPAYVVSGPEGSAHALPFREYGSGQLRLLYTFNTTDQGSRSGSAGVVCLEDGRLTWVWPAEGDILEEGSRAAQEYEEFWQTYLPLLSPSGVELFTRETASGLYGASPAQWTYHHSDAFWSAPESDLPDGVYGQARAWLEGLTQGGCNPWQAEGLSAAWQIRSLTPADGRWALSSSLSAAPGEADYLLTAQADADPELFLTARLRLRPGSGEALQAVEWTTGTPQELGLDEAPFRCPLPLTDGRTLTLEFDESPIDGVESTVLIRQVRVWDGPVLLQSITAGSVWEDGLHLYEGLYRLPDADKVPGAPDLRDLNGDGSADLGLLANCGFPHNVNYAHFLWNEELGQLAFSGLFSAPLELEDTGGVVETEHVSNQPDIRRRYAFSDYGIPLLTGMVSRGPLPPEEGTLPIPEEGVHFTFSSGAGAWCTDLTLFPDGTFSGEYRDSDIDITYLCQFQGTFSMLTPLDSRTWSLTLTDLEVTTGRPEGTEWTEGGIRYAASAPYGLDGGNEFRLCLPGTPAEEISPRCRSWSGGYYGLFEPGAALSGYALCDLRAGYGFFSFS